MRHVARIATVLAVLIAGGRAFGAEEIPEPSPDPPMTAEQSKKIGKTRLEIEAAWALLRSATAGTEYENTRHAVFRRHVQLVRTLAELNQGQACWTELHDLRNKPERLGKAGDKIAKHLRKRFETEEQKIDLLAIECGKSFLRRKRPVWALRFAGANKKARPPVTPLKKTPKAPTRSEEEPEKERPEKNTPDPHAEN